MESIFIETLKDLVIWQYMVLFTFVSYMVITYFGNTLEKKTGFKKVYVVLVIALVLGIPYLFSDEYTWDKILLTYSFGTSFYELIIKRFTKKTNPDG